MLPQMPIRPGCRGGHIEKFDYNSIKADKFKENYLGQQVKLNPEWYAKVKTIDMDELRRERELLRRQEMELLHQEIGIKPRTVDPNKPMHQLDSLEIRELTRRGGNPDVAIYEGDDVVKEADRIEGVGFSAAPVHGEKEEKDIETKLRLRETQAEMRLEEIIPDADIAQVKMEQMPLQSEAKPRQKDDKARHKEEKLRVKQEKLLRKMKRQERRARREAKRAERTKVKQEDSETRALKDLVKKDESSSDSDSSSSDSRRHRESDRRREDVDRDHGNDHRYRNSGENGRYGDRDRDRHDNQRDDRSHHRYDRSSHRDYRDDRSHHRDDRSHNRDDRDDRSYHRERK